MSVVTSLVYAQCIDMYISVFIANLSFMDFFLTCLVTSSHIFFFFLSSSDDGVYSYFLMIFGFFGIHLANSLYMFTLSFGYLMMTHLVSPLSTFALVIYYIL